MYWIYYLFCIYFIDLVEFKIVLVLIFVNDILFFDYENVK